jgi:uncharacterized protein YjbI with pentapeptide repeats
MENTEPKTCQVLMHNDKLCGRPLYDREFCICHSKMRTKNIDLFQEELDKIFADEMAEYYDLTKFYFPKARYQLPREYKKDVHFLRATFSGAADFSQVKFSAQADFSWAMFSGEAEFSQVKFSAEADFTGANFSGEAGFGNAMFSGKAVFIWTTFSGKAVFGVATFLGVAIFGRSTFSGEANFSQDEFSGAVSFRGAKFTGATDFCEATFWGVADFRWASFSEGSSVIFNGEELKKRKREMFPAGAEFIGCSFAEPKNVKFRKVSLEKCKFLETNVTEVQFVDVSWARVGELLERSSRDAVYDEFSAKPDHNLIAQLCRRLQANYVNNYRYAEAGDFYIGEQEMVRKAKGKVGQYLSTNFLYKIISYYGESFLRPLFWLAFVLLLLPAVLLYDGINLNPAVQSTAVVETVKYEWSWSPGDFLPAKSDYWETFVANFSLIAYSRSDIGKYLPESGTRFIVTIESLIVIALLAFFLLALRRQYKRKTF